MQNTTCFKIIDNNEINIQKHFSCRKNKRGMELIRDKKRKIEPINTCCRVVVAVGGNALQRRGEKLSYENQLKAAMEAAHNIKRIACCCRRGWT